MLSVCARWWDGDVGWLPLEECEVAVEWGALLEAGGARVRESKGKEERACDESFVSSLLKSEKLKYCISREVAGAGEHVLRR